MQTGKKSNLDENLKFSVCSHEIGTKIIFQRIARHFLFFLQCFTAKIPYTKNLSTISPIEQDAINFDIYPHI